MRRIFPELTPLVLTPLLLVAAAAHATAGEEPDRDQPAPARIETPFGRNSVGVEFAATTLVEAWNLNERREWLAGGSAAIWWAFRDSAELVVEVQATRVYQSAPRNGFVQALAPLLRWHLHRAEPWTVFAELGPGISWSDTRVPPRGTRFNYLALGGVGITHRLGTHTQAIAGFRWLHLSNAGREGRASNPDIEAFGPYAGVRLSF
jgi:hypothetical protein